MSTDGNDQSCAGVSDAVGSQLRVRVGVLERPRLVAVFERLGWCAADACERARGVGKNGGCRRLAS